MKTLLLLGATLFLSPIFSQTTIYQENFETGNSFTMNSSDMGGSTTYNTWLKNNVYSGGTGTFVCMGFPFSFTAANTTAQPAGITGFPNSSYMHISAQAAVSSGITCASYVPADGTCVSAESHFTKMTSPISTTGFNSVSFDFWWMCAGSVDAFGQLYYSLNGGSTWVLKQSNMNNVTGWTQTAFSDPLWDNQASLMFAFRFVNNLTSTGADPSFCIDQLLVTGISVSSNSITTTNDASPASWCFNAQPTGTVNFTSSGTYTAGNVYTAQLSDASGSFAAPTSIGTLSSTSSGSLSISTSIPSGIVAGSGYRVRVISSNPATTGTDNTANLVINALPSVTMGGLTDVCINNAAFSLTQGAPASGVYSGPGVTAGMFNPSAAGAAAHTITYSYTDANSCMNSANTTINVNALPTVTMGALSDVCVYYSASSLTQGAPASGTYSGTGVSGGMFTPSSAGLGAHTVTYTYADGNGCSNSANTVINVNACASIDELNETDVIIVPNPVETSFQISGIDADSKVELVDFSGKVINSFDKGESSFDISNLSEGVYIVRITKGSDVILTKLVKK